MDLTLLESILTQYAGVGESPGLAVGSVGRMAVGLTRVVCARCGRENTGETRWHTGGKATLCVRRLRCCCCVSAELIIHQQLERL